MAWGQGGYGAHGERSLSAAQTTWHFAEGDTGGGFDLFYLLQNPAGSRFTYDLSTAPVPWSDRAERRFGVLVESLAPGSAPIVVERAVYWGAGGVPFEAGLGAMAGPLP